MPRQIQQEFDDDGYTDCPECGDTTHTSESFEEDGLHFCSESCYENYVPEGTLIHPYTSKFRLVYMHKGKEFGSNYRMVNSYADAKTNALTPELYMGAELETECVNGDLMNGARYVTTNSRIGDVDTLHLKSDASISYGFEIVTQPGTLEFFMEDFNWQAISGLANLGFHSWKASSCGLHIHLSRNSFVNDAHLMKFIYFIFKNRESLVQFAGRESRRFAAFDINQFLNGYSDWDSNEITKGNTLLEMAKGYVNNRERYLAVNLQNSKTIELRFFRPSLNPITVQAALQFCQASFEYTKDVTAQQAVQGGLMFNSFNSWLVSVNSPRFSILRQRIVDKVK
jgi:hypothetical protein